MKAVLVIAGADDAAHRIRSALGDDYKIDAALSREDGLTALQQSHYDLAFIDLLLFQAVSDIREPLDSMKAIRPALEIIVMIPKDHIREAVNAVRSGA